MLSSRFAISILTSHVILITVLNTHSNLDINSDTYHDNDRNTTSNTHINSDTNLDRDTSTTTKIHDNKDIKSNLIVVPRQIVSSNVHTTNIREN